MALNKSVTGKKPHQLSQHRVPFMKVRHIRHGLRTTRYNWNSLQNARAASGKLGRQWERNSSGFWPQPEAGRPGREDSSVSENGQRPLSAAVHCQAAWPASTGAIM